MSSVLRLRLPAVREQVQVSPLSDRVACLGLGLGLVRGLGLGVSLAVAMVQRHV